MEWIIGISIVGSFAMTIIIVIAFFMAGRHKAKLRAEVQMKLIDKFGTAPELIQFLESESGQQFINRVQGAPATVARTRVLAGFRRAVVLAVLGLGFSAIWIVSGTRAFLYPGFLLLALGVGLGAAAFLSLKLAERFGIDERRDRAAAIPEP